MRLIDADKLETVLTGLTAAEGHNRKGVVKAICALHDMPTVDAVPVVPGHWSHLGGDEWCCSACGNVIFTEGSWEKPTRKFCDECGAKMDRL